MPRAFACNVLHPGVGDDHVEPAEAFDGRLDRATVALAGGEIGHVPLAGPASIRRIEVNGQHVEAVMLEALPDRSADPTRRAGHDGGPPLAGALHGFGLYLNGVGRRARSSPARLNCLH